MEREDAWRKMLGRGALAREKQMRTKNYQRYGLEHASQGLVLWDLEKYGEMCLWKRQTTTKRNETKNQRYELGHASQGLVLWGWRMLGERVWEREKQTTTQTTTKTTKR